MAISYQTGGLSRELNGTTLTVSAPPDSGSNRVFIVTVCAFNSASTPPDIVSVVRDSKSFTEITALRQSWSGSYLFGYSKVWVFYLFGADITDGIKNIVVTFDGTFGMGFVTWQQLNGAYQGAPEHYVFAKVRNDFGPLTDQIVDTQLGGYLVGVGSSVERTASGQYYATFENFEGNLGEAGGGSTASTFEDQSNWMNFKLLGGLSVGGVDDVGFGWENQQQGNPIEADVFFVLVEVNDTAWTPAVAGISSVGMCPYVSAGQVREMINNVTGLDHLEDEEVSVQADGIPENSQTYTVSGGTLDNNLPGKAAVIHIGLPYQGKLKLLKASDGNPAGSGQMKKRRIFDCGFRVFRSLVFDIGLDEDNLQPVILGDPILPLRTGDLKKLPKTKWDEAAQLLIEVNLPVPVFILAIITQSEVENL